MSGKPEIKGEMGAEIPEGKAQSEDMISKEETMFKMGNDGKVIPEKYPVKLYDRALDAELVDESLRLLAACKKQKAIMMAMQEATAKQVNDMVLLKKKIEGETDEKIKDSLKLELNKMENTQVVEEFKGEVSSNIVDDGIKESRELIKELNKIKDTTTQIKHVELQPCNSSEAYMAFSKGRSVEGKDVKDWVADLISKKIKKPSYSIEDANNLKPDFKIALKDAIAEASGYRMKNYREIMMEEKMKDEKPLTIKKEMPNESKTTPTVSA